MRILKIIFLFLNVNKIFNLFVTVLLNLIAHVLKPLILQQI